MFSKFRHKLAKLIAPQAGARMYHAAKASRLTSGFGETNSSADQEISSSLGALRSRSRQLMRDASYAKRAKAIALNNVIGAGVGLQGAVFFANGTRNKRVNDSIEAAFEEWSAADSCHTGGELCFQDIERMAFGQIFEAGEIFLRIYRSKFGNSDVPLAIEVIEPERIADTLYPAIVAPNTNIRMGVEVGAFGRPVAYYLRKRHPNDTKFEPNEMDFVERVPAEDIFHLRILTRWPQTRGVPWLHTAIRKLNDMDGYSEAEIVAARAAASYMGFVETEDARYGDGEQDGKQEINLEAGIVERLLPGEKFNFVSPNRPNSAVDPFMRMMLREVAAGADVSYESVSRDYSQSNYSSSRLALLDDRDLWRVLQLWWIRSFRKPLHAMWVNAAVLSRAVQIDVAAYASSPKLYSAASFKPRGWNWIDPTKEVEAYKEAVRCGFTTVTEVISQNGNGRDVDEVFEERKNELDLANGYGLDLDTDVVPEPAEAPPLPPAASGPVRLVK